MNFSLRYWICVPLLPLLASLASCSQPPKNQYQGYAETQLIYIASPFSGTLHNLYIQRGEMVKAQQPLFELDQQPESTQLAQAQANLGQAQANLVNLQQGQRDTVLAAIKAQIGQVQAQVKLTQAQLKRARTLYADHSISKNDFEIEQANYNEAVAQLKQFQANLAEGRLGARNELIQAQSDLVKSITATVQQAQWALQQKAQRAPTDALVFDTYYNLGEYVTEGTPVLSLYTPQTLHAIFYVPEPKLVHIHLGQIITVKCLSCSQTYQARIDFISPQAEYTPPVVYNKENDVKLIFMVRAQLLDNATQIFHPGQPLEAILSAAGSP
ncbi:MAG: HlyD family efflux transporter periplasmic adaptor subunit [Gammaproteobacteria bacterium]|nr:HlyD family efflux transporter periplasmic adaptor subunit [Gammaproteobacteria bacterium]